MYPFQVPYTVGTLYVLRVRVVAWAHLTVSCPLPVSVPPHYSPSLTLMHIAAVPPPSYPWTLCSKACREEHSAGKYGTGKLLQLLLSFAQRKHIFVLFAGILSMRRKEFVFCSLSFKDKVALSSVFHILAFRYIRGKSPHLTLMILGLTQYKCFAVNF